MINLLKSIVDSIISLFTFIAHSIESLLMLFRSLPSFISFLTSTFSLLPSILIPFCAASISIYVIYLVVGRSKT